jgi:hypothetical protein
MWRFCPFADASVTRLEFVAEVAQFGMRSAEQDKPQVAAVIGWRIVDYSEDLVEQVFVPIQPFINSVDQPDGSTGCVLAPLPPPNRRHAMLHPGCSELCQFVSFLDPIQGIRGEP